jgi:hypothetical protein
MRAWSHAIAMDPNRGPLFLVEHNRRVLAQPRAVCGALQHTVHGMAIELSALLGLIDEFGASPAEPDGVPTGRLEILNDSLKTLRLAVSTETGVMIPLDDDDVRAWETFLENWLRLHHAHGYTARDPVFDIEMEGLVERSFGAKAELLCPKCWDWRSWT